MLLKLVRLLKARYLYLMQGSRIATKYENKSVKILIWIDVIIILLKSVFIQQVYGSEILMGRYDTDNLYKPFVDALSPLFGCDDSVISEIYAKRIDVYSVADEKVEFKIGMVEMSAYGKDVLAAAVRYCQPDRPTLAQVSKDLKLSNGWIALRTNLPLFQEYCLMVGRGESILPPRKSTGKTRKEIRENVDKINEIELVKLYVEKEWNFKQLGNHYGVSSTTIKNRLQKLDIPLRSLSEVMKTARHVELDVDEMIGRYNDGWRIRTLANDYQCSTEHIRKTLKKNGISIRKGSVHLKGSHQRSVPKEECIHLYNIGTSILELSQRYRCSETTIRNRLMEWGIDVKRRKYGRKTSSNDRKPSQIIINYRTET